MRDLLGRDRYREGGATRLLRAPILRRLHHAVGLDLEQQLSPMQGESAQDYRQGHAWAQCRDFSGGQEPGKCGRGLRLRGVPPAGRG